MSSSKVDEPSMTHVGIYCVVLTIGEVESSVFIDEHLMDLTIVFFKVTLTNFLREFTVSSDATRWHGNVWAWHWAGSSGQIAGFV
jgi:hypothetical protein